MLKARVLAGVPTREDAGGEQLDYQPNVTLSALLAKGLWLNLSRLQSTREGSGRDASQAKTTACSA
jgi:hypothetical protein